MSVASIEYSNIKHYTFVFFMCFDLVKHFQNDSNCIQFPHQENNRTEETKQQKYSHNAMGFYIRATLRIIR